MHKISKTNLNKQKGKIKKYLPKTTKVLLSGTVQKRWGLQGQSDYLINDNFMFYLIKICISFHILVQIDK